MFSSPPLSLFLSLLFFLFLKFSTWFTHACRKFRISSPSPLVARIFHAHANKTHAENVCTRTRSTRLPRWRFLAPLHPSFSLLSPRSLRHPFASLSSSIPSSPSLLVILSLSFSPSCALARAQVSPFFLLSLLSRRHPSSPLFDAGIPAKTICQDAGRNCKAGSTLFNLEIQREGPTRGHAFQRKPTEKKLRCYIAYLCRRIARYMLHVGV